MDINQLAEKLMSFGLTRQEAVIYLCLCQNHEMTGYEVAKQTGISRSNAYNALAGLVDKGAAYKAEGKAVRYFSVDAEEFCNNKIRSLEEEKEQIKYYMPNSKEDSEGYLTIKGDEHIRNKIKNMLLQFEERVYISMSGSCLKIFEEDIKTSAAKGKKVVILTNVPFEADNITVYQTEDKGRQIGVITDSSYVLTGILGQGYDSTCLYSDQANFVQLFKDSLRNEIRLTELMKGE